MRQTGKTTRLIDQAIQSLFANNQLYLLRKHALGKFRNIIKDGSTLFVDPDHKMSNMAQNDFIYRVMKRLEFEHFGTYIMIPNKDYIHIKTK
jgi:hypothetical protein